ncbi:energy-coupling factor transporter transmembrane component T family protein [Corynebacterium aquilae]|uniref:ABC transporter n=1 Tax=Corynebacterium aquilae DSM 44791 TaxID=1431546 RepID=A0A1L7CF60_9CORY|nr:energy-coupling factor transporter transmembrane component T [Corynebacterium aquilae]APT84464.1 ABC transporter [Corynebacterium aquilae DSM 44791]
MNVIAGTNPVARILAVMIIGTPLLITVDIVSALVTVVITWLLAPLCGVSWKKMATALIPVWIAAPLAGISMLLYGQPGGQEYLTLWLITISDNSITLAIAIMLRILAIASPVVIAAAGMDPTELGDALSQVAHLPSRFVIGAIAGARLGSLFRRDWAQLERSRRSRGLGDETTLARLSNQTFALLVLALRRGTKLATAMEARGFGGPTRRTWARPSRLHRCDLVLVCASVLIPTAALGLAIITGSFTIFGLS